MVKKNFYILLLAFTVFSFSFIHNSFANILFSKTYIVLDKSNRSEIFQITNLSAKKMRYKAKLLHYKQLSDGRYEVIKNPTEKDMIADDLVYMSPRSFVLEPKETQTIRVMRKNYNSGQLKNLPEGEYRSHLLVIEDSEVKDIYDLEQIRESETKKYDKGISIEIFGLMGTSIPLIVRKGDLDANAKIESATPFVDKDGKAMIKVNISRDGNRSVRGDIFVKADGELMGIMKNFAVYTSTNNRVISIPLNLNLEDNSVSNIKRTIERLKSKKIEVSYIDSESKKDKILAVYTSK